MDLMGVRRMLALIVVSLCSLGGLSLSASTALAVSAPTIEEESVSNVAGTSATLQAQIDPQGSETTYRFEYGSTASYGSKLPVAEGSAGSESRVVTVSVHAQELLPATTYHFRVVATSAGGVLAGLDETFTTQAVGGSFSLPDGREWELVSPADKHGQQIFPTNGSVSEAAEDGSAVTYTASGPFVAEAPANVTVAQVFSRRGPSGWSSQDISPPQEGAVLTGTTVQSEYVAFSSNLGSSLVEPFGQTRLSPSATERTLYVRNDSTGEYEAMLTPANVLPGAEVGAEIPGFGGADGMGTSIVTATPDLSHVVLGSNQQLTAGGNSAEAIRNGEAENIYEWVGGRPQLVDEPPADEVGDVQGRYAYIGLPGNGNLRHAISDDGSRIFWSMSGGNDPLYMRDIVGGKTIRINVAQGVSEPTENSAAFQLANASGSEVFFADNGQLTTVPGGGLYVYDVESDRLTLLTVATDHVEAPGVEGVLPGASEDGSYLYLVASGVLSENENVAGEKAFAGANNLYMLHSETHNGLTEWKTSFVAGLAAGDDHDWLPEANGNRILAGHLTARVSPDGRYLAFMSGRSLTGYDNVDSDSDQRDEEVYLYDAQSGRLACASCDPTGARPTGAEAPLLPDLKGVWTGRWLAGSVPSWVESGFGQVSLYQSRYLSDSGRLFFDSSDALVSWDTNGTGDVYEFEPLGVGDCVLSSVTYSVQSGGCVALISGGQGERESSFVDASVSGDDVFFVSAEGLVQGDADKAYDLYDAHVCGAGAPCPAAEEVSPPPCDTADSCKAPVSPQPSIFGSYSRPCRSYGSPATGV